MINTIEPKVELWKREKGDATVSLYKHIARCARVCYQANKVKDDESEYDYICRVLFRGKGINEICLTDLPKLHLSVLEHGTIYMTMPKTYKDSEFYLTNPYSVVREGILYYYITTNLRVIVENSRFNDMLSYMVDEPTYHEKRYTFSILTDIGCSRELNRHRTHSVSEESTRYCKYTASKFGGSITTVRLPWLSEEDYADSNFVELADYFNSDDWKPIDWYLYSVEVANKAYSKLIEAGWTAQQAREVLPLSTKTQVIHTASRREWNHFLKLRYLDVSGKCHPIMSEVAKQIKGLLDGRK